MGLTSGFVLLRFHVAGHRFAVGGWPFPCPGFPGPAPMRSSFRRPLSLLPDASSSKAIRFRSLPSPDCRPKPTEVLGSSPGVPQRSPLHRHPCVRPLSVARGSGLPHPNAFRPCRSSRLRRFTPHTVSRVCCTPQPVMGFTRFPAEGRLSPTPDISPSVPFPFEALPDSSGWPVSRLPASSPLSGRTEVLRFSASRPCSGLASRTDRVATADTSSIHGVPSTQAFTRASSLLGMASFRMILGGILADAPSDTLPGAPRPRFPADPVAPVTRRLTTKQRASLSHTAAAVLGAGVFPSMPLRP